MNPISLRHVVQLKNLCDNMCDNFITRQDVPWRTKIHRRPKQKRRLGDQGMQTALVHHIFEIPRVVFGLDFSSWNDLIPVWVQSTPTPAKYRMKWTKGFVFSFCSFVFDMFSLQLILWLYVNFSSHTCHVKSLPLKWHLSVLWGDAKHLDQCFKEVEEESTARNRRKRLEREVRHMEDYAESISVP